MILLKRPVFIIYRIEQNCKLLNDAIKIMEYGMDARCEKCNEFKFCITIFVRESFFFLTADL